MFRKSRGAGAVLCFMGHALMENGSGLVVDAELTRATSTAERLAALATLEGFARETQAGASRSAPTRHTTRPIS